MTTYKPSAGLGPRLARFVGDQLANRGAGKGRLCILNYHRILEAADPLLAVEPTAESFRWQMQLLADCFNVLSLHEALAALDAGCLPPRTVCITFDDGYRSTHDLALPILKEFNFPATVFVTSGYVGEGSMWNDRILEAVRMMNQHQLDLRDTGLGVYPLTTIDDRNRAIAALTEQAKYLAPPLRHTLVERLDQLAGIGPQGPMLTADMIRALSRQGVEIGAHTVSHPILTSLADATAMHEIAESKRQLEAIVGKAVRYFAYPNGKHGMDFDERHVAMARQAGFAAAFTTALGAAAAADDRFALPRSRPWDTTRPLYVFRLLRWLAR
jgi:peptidoglycan/xylan/chitin deacetylase (PgdA/CDA1 family)